MVRDDETPFSSLLSNYMSKICHTNVVILHDTSARSLLLRFLVVLLLHLVSCVVLSHFLFLCPVGFTMSNNSRVHHFKLVLLGDTAVGKSCLVVRFVRDEFFEFQEPTIGGKIKTTGSPRLPETFASCHILRDIFTAYFPRTTEIFARAALGKRKKKANRSLSKHDQPP